MSSNLFHIKRPDIVYKQRIKGKIIDPRFCYLEHLDGKGVCIIDNRDKSIVFCVWEDKKKRSLMENIIRSSRNGFPPNIIGKVLFLDEYEK